MITDEQIARVRLVSRKTCETCKFFQTPWNGGWIGPKGAFTEEEGWEGEEKSDWGVCEAIGHPGKNGLAPNAFTNDGSDYESYLNVRKDFGCLLWKEKKDG